MNVRAAPLISSIRSLRRQRVGRNLRGDFAGHGPEPQLRNTCALLLAGALDARRGEGDERN
jgi:hypothetical protein